MCCTFHSHRTRKSQPTPSCIVVVFESRPKFAKYCSQGGGRTTSPNPSSTLCFRCCSVSHIREAIVKMLARPAFGQPSQVPDDRDDSHAAVLPEDSLNPSLRGHQLPKDLSTCVLWCAVGLGALVKGNPVESVRPPRFYQLSVSLP